MAQCAALRLGGGAAQALRRAGVSEAFLQTRVLEVWNKVDAVTRETLQAVLPAAGGAAATGALGAPRRDTYARFTAALAHESVPSYDRPKLLGRGRGADGRAIDNEDRLRLFLAARQGLLTEEEKVLDTHTHHIHIHIRTNRLYEHLPGCVYQHLPKVERGSVCRTCSVSELEYCARTCECAVANVHLAHWGRACRLNQLQAACKDPRSL